jgi:hypothetical protein
VKQLSNTYVSDVPEPEISPEEQIGLVAVPDLKLRRTNPKRFDIHQDWYQSNGEHEDTSVSNRYDNPQPVSASLKLSWEEDALFQSLKGKLQDAGYYLSVVNRKDTRKISIQKINPRTKKPLSDSSSYFDEVNSIVTSVFPTEVISIEVSNYSYLRRKFIEVVLPLQRQNISKEDIISALTASGLSKDMYTIRKKTGSWAIILNAPIKEAKVFAILRSLQTYYPDAGYIKGRHHLYGVTFLWGGGFFIPIHVIESSLASTDQLDWEIENYIEGVSLSKASSLNLISFTDLLLQRRQAYLQSIGNVIVYQDFAQEVKDFVEEKFKGLLDRHPEARKHLNTLSLEFVLRPEDYRDTIGAEYYPETKTIGYYLPKETLKKNWSGIVHEIVHALQDFFQDTEPALVSPPEVTAAYKNDRKIYTADKGEEQAYAIEYEFKQWVVNYANS